MASRLLIRFKQFATPFFALVSILFIFFVVRTPSLWVSFQPRIPWPFLENFDNIDQIWVLFCGVTVAWIIIAEILSTIIINVLHVDVSQQSFLTAWNKRDWYGVLCQFPCIILVEEIIFRGIALFYLNQALPYRDALFICAAVFGVYHLHIFVQSHQWKITLVYVGSSFLLGVIIASLFPVLGIFGAWGYHILAVLYIYLRWIARTQKQLTERKEIKEKN